MINDSSKLDLSFSALTVEKSAKGFTIAIKKANFSTLNTDEVLIKVYFSTLNYKDTLICSGNPGLVRKYPHTAGIDAGGVVEKSTSPRFKTGDHVMVIATPLGVSRPGGLAEYIKVPSAWVHFVPTGMEIKDTLVFGTAGFTAALAIQKLESAGLQKNHGPVLVTGATGGVGLISCFLLSTFGYQVHAVTGNLGANNILSSIGVRTIISRDNFLAKPSFPLLKTHFAAAIDCIGGRYLSVIARQLNPDGAVAVIGMVESESVNLSVMPFILRGIQLIGVSAELSDSNTRTAIWARISSAIKNQDVCNLYSECSFKQALMHLNGTQKIEKVGRIIVRI